jgi:thiamine monophosphate synthase
MDNKTLTIIKKLRTKNKAKMAKNLPALFFFSDRKKFNDIFAVIGKLPYGCAVIIREYDLNYDERLEFARKIIEVARKNSRKKIKVLVGKDWNLTLKIKADGVHFSDLDGFKPRISELQPSFRLPEPSQFSKLSPLDKSGFAPQYNSRLKADSYSYRNDGVESFKPNTKTKNLIITYSCHHPSSINKAKKLGANLIFYSPVFPTASHPNQKPIGTLQLRSIALKNSIPIYALGGINNENIKLLLNCCICGVAGISLFNDLDNL